MLTRAKGPMWHKRQKERGIVPNGLRGLDCEATWGKSRSDGWVYGHGSVALVSHAVPVLGLFAWMPNSGHEAKRMEWEIAAYAGLIHRVCMDSKADDQKLYALLKREHDIALVTVPRKGMDKSPERKRMIREMDTPAHRRAYRKRSTTVEPMQGLVKELFELDRCWMRGEKSNRWLFAAMGVAVQMAQWRAVQRGQSTWDIREEVLGL